MRSTADIKQNASLVRGFLKPLFFDEFGRFSALGPEDFQKVRDGYACAKCLCAYTTYLVRCPVCGHERDVMGDLEDPHADHVDHLKERSRTEGVDSGTPKGFEEFMHGVERDKNIDQVPLKKLLPSKWGRGG